MKTTQASIVKHVEIEDEMVTILRLEGGGLMGIDTSYLANDIGHVYSSVDANTVVLGDEITHIDEDACLISDLKISNAVSTQHKIIDTKNSMITFRINEDAAKGEAYLIIDDLMFTKESLTSATKVGTTWSALDLAGDEVELICISYCPF